MGLQNYTPQPGDTRRDLIALAGFLGQIVGARRAAICALLAGSVIVGEGTGVNNFIRGKVADLLMTSPDQGGPLGPIHRHVRTNYHPDGEGMQ